jgi:hypothetical protein
MVQQAQDFVENNKVIVNCEDCGIRLVFAEYANRFDKNGDYKYECVIIQKDMFAEGYESKNPLYYMGQSVLSELSNLDKIFDTSITFKAYVSTSFTKGSDDFDNIGEYSANVRIKAQTTDKEWCCIEVNFDKPMLSAGGRLTIWQVNECIGRANTFLECLNGSNLADKTDRNEGHSRMQIEKLSYFDYFPKIKKIDGVPTIIQGAPRQPLALSKDELKEAFEKILLELDPNSKVDYEIHIRLTSDAFWSNAIFYVEDTDEGNLFCECICSSEKNHLLAFADDASSYWFFVKKEKKSAFEKLLKRYCEKYYDNKDPVKEELISRISEFGLRSFMFDDGECIQMPLDHMGMCLNGYYWNKKDDDNEYIHIISD